MNQIDIFIKKRSMACHNQDYALRKPVNVRCAKAITEVMGLNYKKSFEPVKRKSVSAATARKFHALISAAFTRAV